MRKALKGTFNTVGIIILIPFILLGIICAVLGGLWAFISYYFVEGKDFVESLFHDKFIHDILGIKDK